MGTLISRMMAMAAGLCLAGLAHAQTNAELRIAHVYSQSGPLEAYGKQTAVGFRMGLEFATAGTMTVAGRKIVVIEKDDQGKPDVGRALLAAAYSEDKADVAVGPTSSGVALAMLPVAAEHRKLLLVEPAVADAITGEKGNRYIFRTARNSSQDAIANALAVDKPGTHIATLAQDSAFGRGGTDAFKQAARPGAVVHQEFVPAAATAADITAATAHIVAALKGHSGRKVVWVLWAGAGIPLKAIEADLKRNGIELTTPGNTLAGMNAFNSLPGMEGGATYYFGFSRSTPNQWLVANHYLRHGGPPDLFTAGGMTAAIALVEAFKRTGGSADTERLIATMEGMSFDTPKGRMSFRKEDHQAMQAMYHFRVSQGARAGTIPDLKLVREIPATAIAVPLYVKSQ
ncbi:MAG TPA: substrate-binding domain-containing protein [Albitalea sp.]|nr:substrate-binding domain-containing protein [Albitalea sp.]